MARWLMRMMIVVILGMATTVLIALACARWSRPTTFASGSHHHLDGAEPVWLPDVWSVADADAEPSPRQLAALRVLTRRIADHYPHDVLEEISRSGLFTGRGLLWIFVCRHYEHPRHPLTLPPPVLFEKQYGWPLLCLSSGDLEEGFIIARGLVGRGIFSSLYEQYHRNEPASGVILDRPRVILWPGFIVNTMVFAIFWLLVFMCMAAGRRWRRSRRGWCPACAYDLRGDLARGCPECGWGREASTTTETRRHGDTEGEEVFSSGGVGLS